MMLTPRLLRKRVWNHFPPSLPKPQAAEIQRNVGSVPFSSSSSSSSFPTNKPQALPILGNRIDPSKNDGGSDDEDEDEDEDEANDERFREDTSDFYFEAPEPAADEQGAPGAAADEQGVPTPGNKLHTLLLGKDPLYPGASVSLSDAILSLFVLYLTHHLSKLAFQSVLDVLQLLLPSNSLPASVDSFLSLFCDSGRLVYHDYCDDCTRAFKENDTRCEGCDRFRYEGDAAQQSKKRMRSFFLELPIEKELRELFQDQEFVDGLSYRRTRRASADILNDIQDGSAYRALLGKGKFLDHPWNLALGLNTDGVSPYSSSTFEMWPIFYQIHDLPPDLRFRVKYTRLCGLWFGKSKPDINLFFMPLFHELQRFYENGFPVSINKKTELCKGIVLTASLDTPAKSEAQCFSHHNGNCGCPCCLNPGMTVSTQSKKNSHVHVYRTEKHQARERRQTFMFAELANEHGTPVFGVKKLSIFALFPAFCIIESFAIDYMHCVCLGVAKKFLSLWFDPRYSSFGWSLSKKVSDIDALLQTITPPRFFKALPRALKDRRHWKAIELKLFLFYTAPVVLESFLPAIFFRHFLLLVGSLHSLMSNTRKSELPTIRTNLEKFGVAFEELYGLRFATLNFHLLQHLADNVSRFGPLWTTSCFPFENGNGFLVRCITGTHCSMTNMVTTALCLGKIGSLSETIDNAKCREWVLRVTKTQREEAETREATVLLGAGKGGKHDRIRWRGTVLESRAYLRNQKRNNYLLRVQEGLLLVDHYVEVAGEIRAVGFSLTEQRTQRFAEAPMIRVCKLGAGLSVSASSILEGPLTCLSRDQEFFWVSLPFSPEAS